MSDTLDELIEVLRTIEGLTDQGHRAFDLDPRQGWSIERLRIFSGSLAERHFREHAIDDRTDPWSELIATRDVSSHDARAAITPTEAGPQVDMDSAVNRSTACQLNRRDLDCRHRSPTAPSCRPA